MSISSSSSKKVVKVITSTTNGVSSTTSTTTSTTNGGRSNNSTTNRGSNNNNTTTTTNRVSNNNNTTTTTNGVSNNNNTTITTNRVSNNTTLSSSSINTSIELCNNCLRKPYSIICNNGCNKLCTDCDGILHKYVVLKNHLRIGITKNGVSSIIANGVSSIIANGVSNINSTTSITNGVSSNNTTTSTTNGVSNINSDNTSGVSNINDPDITFLNSTSSINLSELNILISSMSKKLDIKINNINNSILNINNISNNNISEINNKIDNIIKELYKQKSILLKYNDIEYNNKLNILKSQLNNVTSINNNLNSLYVSNNNALLFNNNDIDNIFNILNESSNLPDIPSYSIPLGISFKSKFILGLPSIPEFKICEMDEELGNVILRYDCNANDSNGLIGYEIERQEINAIAKENMLTLTLSQFESEFNTTCNNFVSVYKGLEKEKLFILTPHKSTVFRIRSFNELGTSPWTDLLVLSFSINTIVSPRLDKIRRGESTLWLNEFTCIGGYQPMLAKEPILGYGYWEVSIMSSLSNGHVRPGIANADVLLTSPLGAGIGGLCWTESGTIHCHIAHSKVKVDSKKMVYKVGDIIGFQLSYYSEINYLTFFINKKQVLGCVIVLPYNSYYPALCTSTNGKLSFIEVKKG